MSEKFNVTNFHVIQTSGVEMNTLCIKHQARNSLIRWWMSQFIIRLSSGLEWQWETETLRLTLTDVYYAVFSVSVSEASVNSALDLWFDSDIGLTETKQTPKVWTTITGFRRSTVKDTCDIRCWRYEDEYICTRISIYFCCTYSRRWFSDIQSTTSSKGIEWLTCEVVQSCNDGTL